MEVFKVRNSEGLYWEGHSSCKFTENGKTWRQNNYVALAIRNASTFQIQEGKSFSEIMKYENKILPNYLKDCEIVKFELKEIETIKI